MTRQADLQSLIVCSDVEGYELIDEYAGKMLLTKHAIPTPQGWAVRTPEEVMAVKQHLSGPVVVKALGVINKRAVNAVKLNLNTINETLAAVESMKDISHRYLIEEMIEGGIAKISVKIKRDINSGLYLVLGAAGSSESSINDSRLLLLPTSVRDITRALLGLRCAYQFHGTDGRLKADVQGAATAIQKIAHFAQWQSSSLAELEVNPMIIGSAGHGAWVADVAVRMKGFKLTDLYS